MRLARLLALAFACSGVLAFIECRTPTEVLVTITSDECAQKNLLTRIYTGATKVPIDPTAPAASMREVQGCEPAGLGSPSTTIGTLTIVPSGADGEFQILVISALNGNDIQACEEAYCHEKGVSSKCRAADASNCIFQNVDAEFIDHDSTSVNVLISSVCLGNLCGPSPEVTCVPGAGTAACMTRPMPDAGEDGAGSDGSSFDGGTEDTTSDGSNEACGDNGCADMARTDSMSTGDGMMGDGAGSDSASGMDSPSDSPPPTDSSGSSSSSPDASSG